MAEPFYAQSPEYWRDQRSFFEETIMIAVARSVLVALSLVLAGAPAAAQSFPTKPVHILVPYAPGGAVDVLARTIGQALSKIWSQLPVVDNRPGAGGIVASQALIQARPDGYTLMLVVCIENLIRFDRIAESYNVSANGRADILLAERSCLSLQVEEPA
jgi:hypothetical protein